MALRFATFLNNPLSFLFFSFLFVFSFSALDRIPLALNSLVELEILRLNDNLLEGNRTIVLVYNAFLFIPVYFRAAVVIPSSTPLTPPRGIMPSSCLHIIDTKASKAELCVHLPHCTIFV
jgi:hypothetical protein